MKATFLYWTLSSGGGHDILSKIPYFLRLHEHKFGDDVRELDVAVNFKAHTVPKQVIGMTEEHLEDFNDKLPKEPIFRIIKTTKKLKIEYVSKHLPFDVDAGGNRGIGKNILEEDGTRGCKRLEKFIREFREVVIFLDSEIEKKCDFDCKALITLIDEKLSSNFPTRDAALIAMEQEERRVRSEQPPDPFEPEPYKSTTLPETFPINRYEEGGYSKYMGTFAKGQFWARVAAEFTPGDSPDNWQSRKVWYAILHKFDAGGNHIGTEWKRVGTTADGENKVLDYALRTMKKFITGLGPVEYGDIEIGLFTVNVEGFEFGLIDKSNEEYGDTVSMQPGDLDFYPPWTGDYDT